MRGTIARALRISGLAGDRGVERFLDMFAKIGLPAFRAAQVNNGDVFEAVSPVVGDDGPARIPCPRNIQTAMVFAGEVVRATDDGEFPVCRDLHEKVLDLVLIHILDFLAGGKEHAEAAVRGDGILRN